MTTLGDLIDSRLGQPTNSVVAEWAVALAQDRAGEAILFYGSGLRTDDISGVLDFYVLRDQTPPAWRNPVAHFLWPDVSYHEMQHGGRTLRAKVATMSIDTFERAARGGMIDTTVWTRFAQPARLIWAATPSFTERIRGAIQDCVTTAAGYAAMLGPDEGEAKDYWAALFRETYGAELRVERRGRGASILAADPAYYNAALVLAWRGLGLLGETAPGVLRPNLSPSLRRRSTWRWRWRKAAGKPLNMARLVKAAWTFDGATRYALWKIERHSGVTIPLTRWRERHPVLAAPGVLFQLWRMARN